MEGFDSLDLRPLEEQAKDPLRTSHERKTWDFSRLNPFSKDVRKQGQTDEIKQEIKAATEQCIKNVQAILKEAGADLEDIGKTTVFLADIKDFAAMNEVYTAMMPKPFPARSTIQVVLRGIPIEIEAIAKRKK